MSGQSQSASRNSTSRGVRARVTQVASGEKIIKASAKATYDGTARKLYSARRAGKVSASSSTRLHAAITGIAASPQTAASTMTIETAVQVTRQATPVRAGAADTRFGTAEFYDRRLRSSTVDCG